MIRVDRSFQWGFADCGYIWRAMPDGRDVPWMERRRTNATLAVILDEIAQGRAPARAPYTDDPLPMGLQPQIGSRLVSYHPLVDSPALYLQVHRIHGIDDAIAQRDAIELFTNTQGDLFENTLEVWTDVPSWIFASRPLAVAVSLFEAVSRSDWRGAKRIAERHGTNPWPRLDAYQAFLNQPSLDRAETSLLEMLNSGLRGGVLEKGGLAAQLRRSDDASDREVVLVPGSLLAAAWSQLFQAYTKFSKIESCDYCGERFEVGTGASTKAKRFCSPSHRVFWNRKHRARAQRAKRSR